MMFQVRTWYYFGHSLGVIIPEAAIGKAYKRIANNPGSKIASGAE
jgi:hypothetical protein